MNDINKIIISGTISKIDEVKTVRDTKLLNACLYTKNGKTTTYINITIWGDVAEGFYENVFLDSKVLVSGRLVVTGYEKNGQKFYKPELIVDSYFPIESNICKKNDSVVEDPFADVKDDLPFEL